MLVNTPLDERMRKKGQEGSNPGQPKEKNILYILLHYDFVTCSGYELLYIEECHTAYKEYDGT